MKYFFYLKILLGLSLLLFIGYLMINSIIINWDNDKLGVSFITHPILILLAYFIIDLGIKTFKDPMESKKSLRYILICMVGVLIPFYFTVLSFMNPNLKIFSHPLIYICYTIVLLWILNIGVFLYQRKISKD